MNDPQFFLKHKLQQRAGQGNLRELQSLTGIDFCSNDYLGFASRPEIREALHNAIINVDLPLGGTGSRLISGNHTVWEQLENEVANQMGTEAALMFQSGYDANLGLLSCIASREDTILYDALAHASIRDGARLSLAKTLSFRHNDMEDLARKLEKTSGRVFVVTETLFSMDGDLCPLAEIIDITRRYNAYLILDEAHAFGIFGAGKGLVTTGAKTSVFARIITFGKAVGFHGAMVLGSALLKTFLVNFSRPFIYTTAIPPSDALKLSVLLNFLWNETGNQEREQLSDLIRIYKNGAAASWEEDQLQPGPVQHWMVPGNVACKALAHHLQQAGFAVKPILSPTVPEGTERIRICLHSFNQPEEIERLLETRKSFR